MIHHCLAVLLSFSLNPSYSQEWERQAISKLPVDYGVFSISVVDENTVWAVAFDQTIGLDIPATHVIKVLRTVDGGKNWKTYNVIEASGRISFDIVGLDSSVALITTQDFNSGKGYGVFKTIDGGMIWSEKLSDPAGGVWIRFFDRLEGIVINRHLMAKTFDGGETWTRILESRIPPYHDDEFTLLASGTNSCVAVGDFIWFGTTSGRIYRSSNRGNSWEVYNTSLGPDALITSIAFSDTLAGLATDSNEPFNTFCTTSDGGKTWTNRGSSTNISIGNITHVPGTEGFFIATSDAFTNPENRMSAYSEDYGHNWIINSEGLAFGGTQFIRPGIGWSSIQEFGPGEKAAMLKWIDQSAPEAYQEQEAAKMILFPNPTKSYLSIKEVDGVFFSYKIFSASGTQIQHGAIQNEKENIDLERLPNGIYFIEMKTKDGSTVTRQFIKVN